MALGYQTQASWLDGKRPYLLSHHSSSRLFSLQGSFLLTGNSEGSSPHAGERLGDTQTSTQSCHCSGCSSDDGRWTRVFRVAARACSYICLSLPCFWEMGDPGSTLTLLSSQLMEKHLYICKKVKSAFKGQSLSAFDALTQNVSGALKKVFVGISTSSEAGCVIRVACLAS